MNGGEVRVKPNTHKSCSANNHRDSPADRGASPAGKHIVPGAHAGAEVEGHGAAVPEAVHQARCAHRERVRAVEIAPAPADREALARLEYGLRERERDRDAVRQLAVALGQALDALVDRGDLIGLARKAGLERRQPGVLLGVDGLDVGESDAVLIDLRLLLVVQAVDIILVGSVGASRRRSDVLHAIAAHVYHLPSTADDEAAIHVDNAAEGSCVGAHPSIECGGVVECRRAVEIRRAAESGSPAEGRVAIGRIEGRLAAAGADGQFVWLNNKRRIIAIDLTGRDLYDARCRGAYSSLWWSQAGLEADLGIAGPGCSQKCGRRQ